ncbi:MAG: hypothetical protein AAB378_00050 [Patescibacteria group bacterium]
MTPAYDKIAEILRSDKDTLLHIEEKMRKRFRFDDVVEKIAKQNEERVKVIMKQFKVKDHAARDLYSLLIMKVEDDDLSLQQALGGPKCGTMEGCNTVVEGALKTANVGEGFFLKWEKAKEFLYANPPKNIMSFLGYENVKQMLEKEDIRKVYAALRFAEDRDWLNNVFFKGYENLKPEDFERRYTEAFVLDEKWLRMAEKFMKKKYHNVSHLKELGLIFVLPEHLGVPGEALRLFTLLLHYVHEIEFYSQLFRYYVDKEGSPEVDGRHFAELFISALRGDVLDVRLPDDRELNWMIVQRYLAKDDKNDWRLMEPHVNPEALHWSKAESDIAHMGKDYAGLDLSFWHDLDWVGDFYQTETGIDVLVSFNLIDTIMSLVQKKELIKYLYHHQEALWNKIFMAYVGEEEMRALILKNFHKGYISL